MTVVVFKKVSVNADSSKTDYGVSGAFSSEEDAKAFIEAHQDEDKNITYAIANFT